MCVVDTSVAMRCARLSPLLGTRGRIRNGSSTVGVLNRGDFPSSVVAPHRFPAGLSDVSTPPTTTDLIEMGVAGGEAGGGAAGGGAVVRGEVPCGVGRGSGAWVHREWTI